MDDNSYAEAKRTQKSSDVQDLGGSIENPLKDIYRVSESIMFLQQPSTGKPNSSSILGLVHF